MKTLRIIHTAVVIFIISLLIGCSDQLISTGENNSGSAGKGADLTGVAPDSRKIEIKLAPNDYYNFNQSSAGFDNISSISVENLSDPTARIVSCFGIFIYSKTQKFDGCKLQYLKEKEITVQNISAFDAVFEVTLTGQLVKKDLSTK